MSALVEVKTAGLEGKALDWAVADAVGLETPGGRDADGVLRRWYQPLLGGEPWGDMEPFHPSIDWAQGGPLIDKYHIQTSYNGRGFRTASGEYWCAYVCNDAGVEQRPSGGGGTALIAACRAIVATKFPDTILVPAELVAV